MKKRWKMFILAICVAFLFSTVSVAAETIAYSFTFTSKGEAETYTQESAAKSDDETNWYVTILSSNNGVANTISSTNKFQCRAIRKVGTVASNWRTYTSTVTGSKNAYTINVAKGYTMRLQGQKASSSTSTNTLRVSGRFTP